jgi:uncharacterized protein YecT (DUF1311 family)
MIFRALLPATLLSVCLVSPTFAAGFDCAKARAEDEKAICANPELSKLDDELTAAYRAAAAPFKGWKERATPFQRNQSEWVKDRARCGDTVACLKDAYRARIAWLNEPVHLWAGVWGNARYSVSVYFDADVKRPVFRLFNAPSPADNKFMAGELQARFVKSADNKQEGTDAVQVTPAFQPAFRQYETQCAAISINFDKDNEAYLATPDTCLLFKQESDRTLKFRQASYYYPAMK